MTMSDKPKWWPRNRGETPAEIFIWKLASDAIWEAQCKNMGDDEIMMASILQNVDAALDGIEPSDFMMSFPIVRKAWEAVNK